MASTSKAFKIVCGSASSLFDTRWHTQSLRLLFGQGAKNKSELLDCDDAIFLTSSDSAASALLGYAQEEQEMFEGEEVETEPSQSSLLSVWVPSHSEEWVLRSPELVVGRASSAPLTIEGHLWARRSLWGVWVPSHSEEWVLRSLELLIGRASTAPLSVEGHLIGSWVPSHSEEWVLRSPELAVGRASTAPLT